MDALELQIKKLIIEALMIEDLEPEGIGDDLPLFGEGLGLDSVDALELAVEIERVFGVTFPEAARSREVFQNVGTLAAYIAEHRVR
ncbi:MAG: phosphopantetheine-binding protein [Pseudomonadota bacterium]